jgi:hypothetical protein
LAATIRRQSPHQAESDASPQQLGFDVGRMGQFFAAFLIGIPLGMMVFIAVSLSIYLKHQFPLVVAPFLLAKASVLVALWTLVVHPPQLGRSAIRVLASLAIFMIVVDHVGTQVVKVRENRPMATAWIPAVEARSTSSFAVSWIPSAAAGYASGGVVGIAPGREREVVSRLQRGEAPFAFADLMEINPRMEALEDHYHVLRPDFWLYFATDNHAEFDETVPTCQRTWGFTLLDSLTRPLIEPRISNVSLSARSVRPGELIGYKGRLNGSGRDIKRITLRDGMLAVSTARPGCDGTDVQGTLWVPPGTQNGNWQLAIEAERYDGTRFSVGRLAVRVSNDAPTQPVPREYGPLRQPSPEMLAAILRMLRIEASGEDFVLFDLRPLWEHN